MATRTKAAPVTAAQMADGIRARVIPTVLAHVRTDVAKSLGYYGYDKVGVGTDRYQCAAAAWQIGSKGDKSAKLAGTPEAVRDMLTLMLGQLVAKTSSNGKPGFYAAQKLIIGETAFQCSVSAWLIAPK